MADSENPRDSASVVAAEADFIREKWQAKERGPFPSSALGGLALSGGGIRSASFAFGVMQALAATKADAVRGDTACRPSVLQRLQYLSTVSGGGFAGTAVTRLVNSEGSEYDLADKFPFRLPDGPPEADSAADSSLPCASGESRLPRVRYKASYLDMGSGSGSVTVVAVVLRTIFLTTFTYLLGAAAFVGAIYPFALEPKIKQISIFGIQPNGALLLSFALLVCLLFSWILYSILSGANPIKHLNWAKRRQAEAYSGDVAFLVLVLAGLSLVGYFPTFRGENNYEVMPSILIVLGGLGTAGAFMAQFKSLFGGLSDRRWLPAILIWASGIALMAALLIGGREIALAWFRVDDYPSVRGEVFYWVWVGILAAAFAALGLLGNVNYIGLHRFYRDRLMQTFVDRSIIPGLDDIADNLKLDAMDVIDKGLYPLVNANVVLVNSRNPKFKVRGGDSYLLSPHFTGCEATGWAPTRFRKENMAEGATGGSLPSARSSSALNRHLSTISLASAMAVSGAALNPSTGSDGEGPTRSGMLPIILSVLGIRLGYWQPNPKMVSKSPEGLRRPNFIDPGLLYGILQRGHTEDAKWLEITDGGHFENMGLYELFRRKVRLIIVADGSTDPDFSMSSFASAYERARNDFGVEIDIASYPANFNDMMPDSARPNSAIKRRYRLAEHGFAIGVFTYPEDRRKGEDPAKVGYIFYVNTVLTENLKSNLYSYKAEHPQFPDEPLSDQFFNEKQFDAYCQLGRELTEQMLEYARGYAELAEALGLRRKPRFKYWEKVKEPAADSPENFLGAKLDGLREAIHATKSGWA